MHFVCILLPDYLHMSEIFSTFAAFLKRLQDYEKRTVTKGGPIAGESTTLY